MIILLVFITIFIIYLIKTHSTLLFQLCYLQLLMLFDIVPLSKNEEYQNTIHYKIIINTYTYSQERLSYHAQSFRF